MFSHLLKYSGKIFFGNREGLFFGILFPLVFGLVYLFAFQGFFETDNTLEPAPVVVVLEDNQEETLAALESLDNIGAPAERTADGLTSPNEETGDLLLYYETGEVEAENLMEEGIVNHLVFIESVDGVPQFSLEVSPQAANDISSNIVYTALNTLSSIGTTIQTLYTDAAAGENPAQAVERVNQTLESVEFTSDVIVDAEEDRGVSGMSIFYYSSLAYICIFFMAHGISIVSENEAFYSPAALLSTAGPVPKAKRFLATFTVAAASCLAVVYLLLYVYHLNDVPLGNDTVRLVALMTLGVLVGLLLGTAVASIFKDKQNLLTGISIGLPIFLGTLSGLVNLELKVLVMDIAPWAAKLNPVALINDALYYLNNYPTYAQYNQNMLILSVFALVFLMVTLAALRRTDYENL